MKMIYLLIFTISIFGCEQFPMDKRYRIFLKNNSGVNLQVYKALGDVIDSTAYPDTSLPRKLIRRFLEPNIEKQVLIYDGSGTIESFFERRLKDTLSIFIFNADTLQKYPWDTIRKRYMVLIRYDLSLQDLKNRRSFIEYPYDSTKGKLKVWPKK